MHVGVCVHARMRAGVHVGCVYGVVRAHVCVCVCAHACVCVCVHVGVVCARMCVCGVHACVCM